MRENLRYKRSDLVIRIAFAMFENQRYKRDDLVIRITNSDQWG